MELYQVRYFLAICEYGSFSRAAQACDVSQPALTVAIKKLESELGAPLFHREGKRVVLTDLGGRTRPHLQQMVDEAGRAQNVARNLRLLRQAPMRVGASPTLGPSRLSQFLSHFHSLHAGIELTVQERALPGLLRDLEAGDLDVGVASAPEGVPDVFRTEQLYREPYVVAFPPGHPFERMESIRLVDTSRHDYIDRLGCELREAVMAVCMDRGVELYAAFRSDRDDWVQAMVRAGLGFAFMPVHSVCLPDVLTRPLTEPVVERPIVAIEVRGRPRSAAAKLFCEALQRYRWPPPRRHERG